MASHVADLDLGAAHTAIDAAIVRGDAAGLTMLGWGEMTLVVGWPPDGPTHAVKRLPPFPSAARLAAYERLVTDYIAALAERGVACVPTDVRTVSREGSFVAYLVQPLQSHERLLSRRLEDGLPHEAGLAALTHLAQTVAGAVDARVGIDGQVSNWAVGEDGDLLLLDLTTPLLCDADGRERLDTHLFTAVYPWLVRAPLRRFVAPSVMADFHRPRTILLDAASNLLRENLDPWMPVMVQAANTVLDAPLTHADVERYYRSDTRLWGTTERLRRAERFWRRRVRRRPYPVLLAPPGAIRPPRRRPSITDTRP